MWSKIRRKKKGQSGARKLPHTQGSGKGKLERRKKNPSFVKIKEMHRKELISILLL